MRASLCREQAVTFDMEAIERMVALSCAAFSMGEDADFQEVLSIADSYLEFIDPLADREFLKQPVSPNA